MIYTLSNEKCEHHTTFFILCYRDLYIISGESVRYIILYESQSPSITYSSTIHQFFLVIAQQSINFFLVIAQQSINFFLVIAQQSIIFFSCDSSTIHQFFPCDSSTIHNFFFL
uniref:Uncharacterized protein n=1 Tax=Cacopsylla melanoneura TaxID=428564 RepID=A0A8D9BZ28_9HEMI